MIVSAVLRNVKISSQKVCPVVKKVRNMSIEKAMDILTFSNKKASFFVKKILKSVVANAENNNNLDVDKLFVYCIYVCAAASLKRSNLRAKGKSDKIIKRSCHIFVKVKEKL